MLSSIENLIFDLGGVILDLHIHRTHEAFARAGGQTTEEIRNVVQSSAFFNEYEKGLLTDDQFRSKVRDMVRVDLSDQQIDDGWNAMLGGIPAERLQLLKSLKKNYRVFLLSNTNSIHLRCFDPMVQAVSDDLSLNSFFEVAYFSHLLNMRKPDREIYDHVVKANNLRREATLFLDDNLDNLKGAEAAGLKTFHVSRSDLMMALFS